MPCAHSSWHPTRRAGQTTSSMVSRLSANQNTHWLTGTSSPCLSVFKPIVLGGDIISTAPKPQMTYDSESLFWRHERLHRLVLKDYNKLKETFDDARVALEANFVSLPPGDITTSFCRQAWELHRQALPDWLNLVEQASTKRGKLSLFNVYWSQQEKLDGMNN